MKIILDLEENSNPFAFDSYSFSNIPNSILIDKTLNNNEKIILIFLASLKWRENYLENHSIRITSKSLAIYLGISYKHLRRYLKILSEKESVKKYMEIKFKANKEFNQPDDIILNHLWIPNQTTTLKEKCYLDFNEMQQIDNYLKRSIHFSGLNANYLCEVCKPININQMQLALIYVDTKKNVKVPLAYLKKCFSNGKFIYNKEILENTEKISKAKKGTTKINDNYLFEVLKSDVDLLEKRHKNITILGFSSFGFGEQAKVQIYSINQANKNRNIENFLNENLITFEICKVRDVSKVYQINIAEEKEELDNEEINELKNKFFPNKKWSF